VYLAVEGKITVLKAGAVEVVAVNDSRRNPFDAGAQRRRLYVRTRASIYCFGVRNRAHSASRTRATGTVLMLPVAGPRTA
jgi:hypothetical protein